MANGIHKPSHTLGWDFSSGVPQLKEGFAPKPTYGRAPTATGGIHEGRHIPIQIGTTPTGIDYSAKYRPAGTSMDDGGDTSPTSPSGASYASQKEFKDWVTTSAGHGYYGTIDDAINTVNTNPDSDKARAALTDFYNNVKGTPYAVKTPGLIGKIVDVLGVNTGDVGQNVFNAGITLDQSFTQPGSFDYMDTVTPSNQALDTLNTYTPTAVTSDTISAGTSVSNQPTTDYSDFATPAPTPSYSSDDNDSSDDGWGGQAAASDDYGSIDDFGGAGADVGGDSGGGGGGGTYCCTASVKQKVMTNKELYALHKWHHSQSTWWIEGYDVWGKWVAKNLVSKHKYFAHLTKAFYEWKVNGKFSFKALLAAKIIYPGVIVAGFCNKFKGGIQCEEY